MIDVRIVSCDREEMCKNIADSYDINAIYLSASSNNSWRIIRFKDIDKTEVLVEKLLEHLPEPKELDADEFYVNYPFFPLYKKQVFLADCYLVVY